MCGPQQMRYSLSTYTDGSFIELDTSVSTLVHREDAEVGTRYVRIVGFNRGKRSRSISFTFNDTEAVYATVQPNGTPQILVPDIPIYNNGNGIDIYTSLRQSALAWNIPENINDLIVLDQGKVVGIVLSNLSASSSAQPILLHVTDSRRSDTDMDPSKGSESIIELYQNNGSVALEIINSGHNLADGNLLVRLKSGVYIYGDIFAD